MRPFWGKIFGQAEGYPYKRAVFIFWAGQFSKLAQSLTFNSELA
jgi:hypothetical protein